MNKTAKRITGLLLMAGAVALFVFVAQLLVTNDGTNEGLTLRNYYLEDKDSLDVVIMGASEVMYGYSAPEVYRTIGLTSSPYCFTINSAPLWKYELKEIERTQSPELLIVETNGAMYEEDKYIHSGHCIKILGSNMPMTMNRVRFANAMSDDPLELLFPVIKYHYKWSEFMSAPVKDRLMVLRDGHSRLRGAQTYLYQEEYSTDPLYPADDTVSEMNADGEAALREFLEECKESDIPNILFVEFPHVLNDEGTYRRHQRVNRAAQIIRGEGFEFVDFNDVADEIGLDTETDFYDPHHFLATGQKKFSRYLGEYIKEKYDLEPRAQTEKNALSWEDSSDLIIRFYEYYDAFRKEHSEDPHKTVDYTLTNDLRTMRTLERVKTSGME